MVGREPADGSVADRSAVHGAVAAAGWCRSVGLELARELAADAVWADGVCAFHGATAPDSREHPPRYRSTGADLYEGTAGIARFLGRAAVLGEDDGLRRVALGAVEHAIARATGWSLYDGCLGIALVALELAGLLDEPRLVDRAAVLVDRAAAGAASGPDRPWDLLVGTAGAVIGLVGADGGEPGCWTRHAVDLGGELLAAAIPDGADSPDGPPLSWLLRPGSTARLCGLAHGASGVALAFETLAAVDPGGPGRWHRAARQARTFERAYYAAELGSWADLRPSEAGSPVRPGGHPHMWCHGSIGICAERLGALEHDESARADAVGGLAGARSHAERLVAGPTGPGAGDELNASVCHGTAGLVDLFVDAGLVSGDPSWTRLAGEVAGVMLDDARRVGGWRSGVPGGWPAPGLMLGRAGTGWALLRMADPATIPSVWRAPVIRRASD